MGTLGMTFTKTIMLLILDEDVEPDKREDVDAIDTPFRC